MSCYWDPTEIKVTRGPRINSSHTLRALSGQNKYPKKTLSHIFLFIAARNVNNNDQYGDVKKGPFRTQICVKLTRMKDELQDYSSLQRWQFLTKYKSSQPAPIYRSMFSHNSVEQIEIVTWQELISRDLFFRKIWKGDAIWIENHSGTTFWMQMRWCRGVKRIFLFPTEKVLNFSEKRMKVQQCLFLSFIGFFIKSGVDQILVWQCRPLLTPRLPKNAHHVKPPSL